MRPFGIRFTSMLVLALAYVSLVHPQQSVLTGPVYATRGNPLHLCGDFIPPSSQLLRARPRIGFGTLADLPEQPEQGPQPGLGADEGTFAQRSQPTKRLLCSRRQIEVGLIFSLTLELAQPPFISRSPIVEIEKRGFRKAAFSPSAGARKRAHLPATPSDRPER